MTTPTLERETNRHDHRADRFNRPVFYRMTPWAWAIEDHDLICDQMIMGDSLASIYPQEPYETIVAYVGDNLGTPVITADDDD